LHPDAPGTYRAKHPGNLAGVAGNSGGGLPRPRAAPDAEAWPIDGDLTGTPPHRFAGGAGFLSSLHSPRTLPSHHRTLAGARRAARRTRSALHAAVED